MPSDGELPHALAAAMPTNVLDEHLFIAADHLSICTMHLAKALEFRAVAVLACADSVIPSKTH